MVWNLLGKILPLSCYPWMFIRNPMGSEIINFETSTSLAVTLLSKFLLFTCLFFALDSIRLLSTIVTNYKEWSHLNKDYVRFQTSIALDSFWIWFNKWSPLFKVFLYELFLKSVGSVSIIPSTLSILHGSLRADISYDSSRSIKLALTPN